MRRVARRCQRRCLPHTQIVAQCYAVACCLLLDGGAGGCGVCDGCAHDWRLIYGCVCLEHVAYENTMAQLRALLATAELTLLRYQQSHVSGAVKVAR